MRAVAKVGIGAANCGFRPTISETPVRKAARVSAVPASSSAEEITGGLRVESKAPQRGWSDFNDWEFAEKEEEKPRVVFGDVPSFGEAREATYDLKDALNRTYLSSPASSVYGYSDVSETKACLTSERTLAPAPSQHAIQAFRFLSESTTAQNVVASIACDPNVWNAVLQNPALQEFLESQKSNTSFTGLDAGATGSVTGDFFFQPSPEGSDVNSENEEDAKAGGLAEFLDNIKLTVVDIWSSLSDYFQNLFMGPAAVFPNADGTARIGFTDKALGGSFMGLAAMAILVVVLKRN